LEEYNKELKGARSIDDFLSGQNRMLLSKKQLDSQSQTRKRSTSLNLNHNKSMSFDEGVIKSSIDCIDKGLETGRSASLTSSMVLKTNYEATSSTSVTNNILNSNPAASTSTPGLKGLLFSTNTATSRPKKSARVRFDFVTDLLFFCEVGDLKNIKNLLGLDKGDTKLSETMEKQLQQAASPQRITPMHLACSGGHAQVLEFLLECECLKVNAQDSDGWTPLHCASSEGNLDIIQILGRCQRKRDNKIESREPTAQVEVDGEKYFYAEDGPINFDLLNNDGETADDIANEENPEAVKKLLQGN
jgi:ankyrin repeat protein